MRTMGFWGVVLLVGVLAGACGNAQSDSDDADTTGVPLNTDSNGRDDGSDAPGTDASGTDAPGTNVPGTDAPGTDAPGTDAPGTDVPGTDVPGTDTPGTDVPGTDVPETDTPGTDTDEVSRTPCWPFDQPAPEVLRSSERRVFAHYFSAYPISLDNRAPDEDYYTRNYLNPTGESGIHEDYGGLLRERPLPRDPLPTGVDYALADLETEVRRAIQLGLDGFAYDVLNPNEGAAHRVRLDKLLAASQRVDTSFRVLLVPDMTASSFGGSASDTNQEATAMAGLRTILTAVSAHPAVLRLDDGRVVIAPFGTHRRSAAFWQQALATLADEGHQLAFMPMPNGFINLSAYDGVPLWGAASWGSRRASAATTLRNTGAAVQACGLVWMAPVAPQDQRPRNFRYIETEGSSAYRALWEAAIESGADWVQLITWNDYSENSQMAPSTRTQTGFYDLTAYYVTWFKTGAPPPIVRDALYYFHRPHAMSATPAKQETLFTPMEGPTAIDDIELVALLRAPGTLEIEVGGEIIRVDVGAGMQSIRAPLREGTPVFRLRRGENTVVELHSATPISNAIDYQDPLFHAGAGPTCPVP